jgi:hypothetical protein
VGSWRLVLRGDPCTSSSIPSTAELSCIVLHRRGCAHRKKRLVIAAHSGGRVPLSLLSPRLLQPAACLTQVGARATGRTAGLRARGMRQGCRWMGGRRRRAGSRAERAAGGGDTRWPGARGTVWHVAAAPPPCYRSTQQPERPAWRRGRRLEASPPLRTCASVGEHGATHWPHGAAKPLKGPICCALPDCLLTSRPAKSPPAAVEEGKSEATCPVGQGACGQDAGVYSGGCTQGGVLRGVFSQLKQGSQGAPLRW